MLKRGSACESFEMISKRRPSRGRGLADAGKEIWNRSFEFAGDAPASKGGRAMKPMNSRDNQGNDFKLAPITKRLCARRRAIRPMDDMRTVFLSGVGMNKLHGPALGPGMIRVLKANTIFDGRVGVKPEDDERTGIRIGEIEYAESLLGSCRCGVRV